MRVCCLALVGALELISSSAAAQEMDVVASEDSERLGAYELTTEAAVIPIEDAQIFAPLSPVTVEVEPVKLPLDQNLESQ